jgi:hypothetical protein
MVQGLGIRATARVFEVDPNTVLHWLGEAAEQLRAFSVSCLCDMHMEQLQLDELSTVLHDRNAGTISDDEASGGWNAPRTGCGRPWPPEQAPGGGRREQSHPGSPGCPPEACLIALVLHEPPRAERADLADHIVRCRRCTDVYQLLLRVRHDRTVARPAPAPPEAVTPAEAIIESNGEQAEKQTPEPPQRSTGPHGHRL